MAVGLLQERADVAEAPRVTVAGLSVQVRPPGDEVWERLTTPAKLLMLVTVIVDEPVAPVPMLTVVGLAEMLKSWTTKATVAV